jgi:hypothetical protein
MTVPAFDISNVVVGGRTFRPSTSTTFRQDMYVMQLVKEAGLDEMAKEFAVDNGEISNVAQDVIVTAFVHGKLFELLGAVMEEGGKKWNIRAAKENAEFFAELNSTEDKMALKGAIVAVILGFFVSGLLASASSKPSSVPLDSSPAAPRNATGPTAASGILLEDTTTSAIGT